VAGGWWLVAGGWWLVAGGWWLGQKRQKEASRYAAPGSRRIGYVSIESKQRVLNLLSKKQ
jgi:hypothetical protein